MIFLHLLIYKKKTLLVIEDQIQQETSPFIIYFYCIYIPHPRLQGYGGQNFIHFSFALFSLRCIPSAGVMIASWKSVAMVPAAPCTTVSGRYVYCFFANTFYNTKVCTLDTHVYCTRYLHITHVHCTRYIYTLYT